jgi:hypothetical protein
MASAAPLFALCVNKLDADLGEGFVLADNDDGHALDFCRVAGAPPIAVTMFNFDGEL